MLINEVMKSTIIQSQPWRKKFNANNDNIINEVMKSTI